MQASASKAAAAAVAPTRTCCLALPPCVRPFKSSVLRCHCSCSAAAPLSQPALDENFMRLALQQAHAAFDADEVPIGAVLVCGSEVVSTGQNATETRRNPLAHAELQCIMTAAESRQAWRLQDATLYCTVEPCPMCAGAILQARLQRLVYGARQPRLGADGSWVALFPQPGEAVATEEAEQQQAQGRLGTPETGAADRIPPVHPTCAAGQQLLSSTADVHAAAAAAAAAVTATEHIVAPARLSAVSSRQPIMPNGSHPFHPDILVTRAVLEEECMELMVKFFRRRRKQAKEAKAAAAAAAAAIAAADLGGIAVLSDDGRELCSLGGDGVRELRARYLGSEARDSDSKVSQQ